MLHGLLKQLGTAWALWADCVSLISGHASCVCLAEQFSDAAAEWKECCAPVLQEKGFDPVYGARPVKRAVQRELETALAKALLRGEFGEDDTVVVDAPGGARSSGLVLTREGGGKSNGALSASFSSMDDPSPVLPIEVQG